MSLDDVFNTGKDFAKAITAFTKSRAMVYTTIAGTLGVGGWGYNDLRQHLHNIESIPVYRSKVDSALYTMDTTTKRINMAVQPLLTIKDTLPTMVKHAHQIEQHVLDNIQMLDMVIQDFYEFKHNTERQLERLNVIN